MKKKSYQSANKEYKEEMVSQWVFQEWYFTKPMRPNVGTYIYLEWDQECYGNVE